MNTVTISRGYLKVARSSTDYDFILTDEIRGLIVKSNALIVLTKIPQLERIELRLDNIESINSGPVLPAIALAAIIESYANPGIQDIAGSKGGRYIKVADGEVEFGCRGFQSWDDATVLEIVKIGGVNVVDSIGLTSIELPIHSLVTWTEPATSIKVSAGRGWVLAS